VGPGARGEVRPEQDRQEQECRFGEQHGSAVDYSRRPATTCGPGRHRRPPGVSAWPRTRARM
jgi:hypothetical protein